MSASARSCSAEAAIRRRLFIRVHTGARATLAALPAAVALLPILSTVVSLLFAAVALPAAAAPPEPARLTSAQQDMVLRLETYLNGITTLEAGFVQMSGRGNFAKGRFWLSRPGRMRFEYEPPTPYLLVADGTWFKYVDLELQTVSPIPLSKTPAGILLRKDFSFSDGLIITAVSEKANTITVEVADADDPEIGRVALTFLRDPITLQSWTVLDSVGQRIRITLVDPVYGKPLDRSLFSYFNDFRERRE